ncbi:bacitracin ABC transporter permease [Lentibacillus amyloliquefaciens]|uniref:Bacitracin ABC transporter permease n=2 Tax=Lentibacillus amyloliquefaciens TaxID=1472767 RepID=A0A0U3NUF8_9BACI|nr:bacitracin ABC transporter permease [Lentibacillus amyloliquefaciens]
MLKMCALISTEFLKSRKSKVIWITFIAFTILPLMGGLFMFVLKHPYFAEKSGLLAAKAQIAGSADWPSYLMLLSQGIAIGGIFVYGFITSWIFGREYTDCTVKDLLSLPFPRAYVPIAKFITVFIWSTLLTIWVIGIGFIVGMVIGLPQWSTNVWQHGLSMLSITFILTILLNPPVAFLACYGRGYLAPLGFIIMTIILSQIVAVIGYGSYFPWAIPAMFSNVSGEGSILELEGLIIIIMTAFIGFAGTLGFWRFADQNR